MAKNLLFIKWVMYSLVVLLNLNQLLDQDGRVTGSVLSGVKQDNTGDLVSLVMFAVLLLGYGGIAIFSTITELPILYETMNNNVLEEKNLLERGLVRTKFRNERAFNGLLLSVIMYVLFIAVNSLYFGVPDWASFLAIIFAPWLLLCIRAYYQVPDTPRLILFCAAVDAVTYIPDVRNSVFMIGLSVAGLFAKNWYTMMLLDIFNLSKELGIIAKVVVLQARSLGLTFYIIAVAAFIYTAFGFTYFKGNYHYDDQIETQTYVNGGDDGDITTCTNLLQCFWMVLYLAVPQGDMGAVIDAFDRNDDLFVGRVWFDLSFFVCVGVLLFNILTGLMVDCFSALREDQESRFAKLRDECFICGYTRSAFDDLGGDFNFDKHVAKEHNVWLYLYFISYLKAKDPTEFNGVESHVTEKMNRQDLKWVPTRTSWEIENQLFKNSESENENVHFKKLAEGIMQHMEEKLSEVKESILSEVKSLMQARE